MNTRKNHKHKWEAIEVGEIGMLKCKCGLSVEAYQDHASIWDYKAKKGKPTVIGMKRYITQ